MAPTKQFPLGGLFPRETSPLKKKYNNTGVCPAAVGSLRCFPDWCCQLEITSASYLILWLFVNILFPLRECKLFEAGFTPFVSSLIHSFSFSCIN